MDGSLGDDDGGRCEQGASACSAGCDEVTGARDSSQSIKGGGGKPIHPLRPNELTPPGFDYSARKATIGFTLVARRAGTKQDSAATAERTDATAQKIQSVSNISTRKRKFCSASRPIK